jgi:hypothetical protein
MLLYHSLINNIHTVPKYLKELIKEGSLVTKSSLVNAFVNTILCVLFDYSKKDFKFIKR